MSDQRNNHQSFKITNSKPPMPGKWLRYTGLNLVLLIGLALYAYGYSWNPDPKWISTVIWIAFFIVGPSFLVCLIAFISDSIRRDR